MSTTNQAACLTSPKSVFSVQETPMPIPKADEIIIRNHAMSINPIDWVMQNTGMLVAYYPFIPGFDVSGEVYQVGASVTNVKVGDRVIAMVTALGTENSYGGFQTFVKAHDYSVSKIPDGITYAEGCVLPINLTTAASALFDGKHLGLSLPQLKPTPQGKVILIWGGGSSVGACAIQLLIAAGYVVATTASANNLDALSSLGAKYVFDRKKTTIVEDIVGTLKGTEFGGCLVAAAFDNSAFDKLSLESPDILRCGEIAKKLGGNMFVQTVKSPAMPLTEGLPEGVKTANTQGTDILTSEPSLWGTWVPGALENGLLTCMPPPLVVGEGLESVQAAVDRWKAGTSFQKVVVTLS